MNKKTKKKNTISSKHIKTYNTTKTPKRVPKGTSSPAPGASQSKPRILSGHIALSLDLGRSSDLQDEYTFKEQDELPKCSNPEKLGELANRTQAYPQQK